MDLKISEAAITVSFVQDNFIRLKQQKAEEIYKNISDKPSANTNAPDTANPATPRIIIKDALKGIAVSQVSAQLSMLFEKTGDLNKQIETLMENTDLFFNDTKVFQGESNIKDAAISAVFLIPSGKPLNELNSYLFTEYSNFVPLGEIVGTYHRTGFKAENNLFVGLEVGTYWQKGAEGQNSESGGYLVKAEINNKLAFLNSSASVLIKPDDVKAKFKSLIDKDIEKFFKHELL
jgi:hypothetical protein